MAVIREVLQMAVWRFDGEVCSVDDEEEWCQHSSLSGPHTADTRTQPCLLAYCGRPVR